MEKKNNYLPLNIQLFADTQLSTENITPVLTPDFFNTDDYQLQLQETSHALPRLGVFIQETREH